MEAFENYSLNGCLDVGRLSIVAKYMTTGGLLVHNMLAIIAEDDSQINYYDNVDPNDVVKVSKILLADSMANAHAFWNNTYLGYKRVRDGKTMYYVKDTYGINNISAW